MRKWLLSLALAAIATLSWGQGGGQFGNGVGGSGSSGPVFGANVTNAANFGIKSDFISASASVTSGQNIVTCPNCHFLTTAVVGNVMQAGSNANGQVINTGTITSVDSDTQVHVSNNASATQAGNLEFAWGVDNTTALTNAYTASRSACSFLYIPAGIYFTTTGQFNTAGTCTTPGNFFAGGVFGDVGWANTTIVALYTFNFATCTGGSGHTCFLGVLNGSYDYLAFDGMFGGSTASSINLTENQGGYFNRIRVNNWCASCANADGELFSSINPITVEGSVVQGGGLAGCLSTSTAGISILNPCFGQTGGSGTYIISQRGLYVNSGTYQSFSGGYGGGTEAVRVDAGATLEEDQDNNVPSGGFGNMITNGTHIMRNCHWNATSVVHSGGVLSAQDTSWTPANFLNINAGGKFIDRGGNTPGTTPTNSGTYQGGNPNVLAVAANLVLSAGWGTTAAWSALSGFNNAIGTITASGTGQAANPTITYTFPTPYFFAPQACNATIVKSNDAGVTLTNNFLAASALTATGVTFTYSGTPVAADTYTVQITCNN